MHKYQFSPYTKAGRCYIDTEQADRELQFAISFDQQALADYLGVERSAMSAELGKLRKEGVLDFKGSHFVLYRT